MAQIQKYTAQQGLNAPGAPRPTFQSYTGGALEQLGGAIETVAARYQEQQQKKEDFGAAQRYRTMQLQLGADMQERAENMAPDGTGFHDSFINEVYNPKRSEFLGSLPPRLREKYELILGEEGPDTVEWSTAAATKERNQLYKWYDTNLGESREQLANAISLSPEQYEHFLKLGMDEIDNSGLPEVQKETHRKAWEEMAQIAHLNHLLDTRPEDVIKELGGDPRLLTPDTQFKMLEHALIYTESNWKTNAISPKGAIGLMQVMPDTAREIATELKDPNFNQNWDNAAITEYLSNPAKNVEYGRHYLKKMIRMYGKRGGLEAALIAYNGGGKRAEAWIKSGFDDSVLPKETANYYKKVLAGLPNVRGEGQRGDPAKVTFNFGKADPNVNPQLTDRLRASFAALGINNVRITSGYRDEKRNAEAGGAENSQHIHRNAVDIDVSGYSHAQRIDIIRALSANGIGGIGVGTNIIHADIGARRAWGYATSAGGGAVPRWAQGAIDEHLRNEAATPRASFGGRYGTLAYDKRQQFINKADTILTQQARAGAAGMAVQKTELRTAMAEELYTLRNTGEASGLVDDNNVATILGEDKYLEWVEDREFALDSYKATAGIAQMSAEQLAEHRNTYLPLEGFASARDERLYNAVDREITRVERERATEPAQAALRYDDVREAWAGIDWENPDPEAIQTYIRLNLERQKEFALKPGTRPQALPRAVAIAYGRELSKIPRPGDKVAGEVVTPAEIRAAIVLQHDAMQKIFGDFADEVILSALSEYHGVNSDTAELITALMENLQAGGNQVARIREQIEAANDRTQVESLADEDGPGMWESIKGWFGFGDEEGNQITPEAPGLPEPSADVTPEVLRRAIGAMELLGEDMTPGDEMQLRAKYGDAAVDAAKAQRSQ